MRCFYLITFLLITGMGLVAQSSKNRVISIPVIRNGIQMRDPWVGGFDSPQFSNCDLNQDGIQDLFVFDRVGNKVYTYLGNGGSPDTMFTYAPQYEGLFPQNLVSWALVRDYNHDGIPDIFTYWSTWIRVYKGSIQNGLLHFDIVANHLNYSTSAYAYTPAIYGNIADIPAFVDVNGDGDLDILTYDIFGFLIAYYENQTTENPGNPAYANDSLKYTQVTTCWGGVEQNANSNSMGLNIDTTPPNCTYNSGIPSPFNAGSGTQRHSGNSLCAFKDPVYNAVDILNGNVGFDDLFFLRNNGGHGVNGYIYEWDSIFPPCGHPMLMASYPAAYGVNISGQNTTDILMAPNGYAPYVSATNPNRNIKNVQYYQSTGDTTCWLSYQSDSFLVHHMLDFGTNSKPVFYDYNGDGLLDMVVANYGYFDSVLAPRYYLGSLAYYQNTGTATQPKFTEITLDLDSISNYNLVGLSPAFGDMNGDGKPDMILGDNVGDILYFQNSGTGGVSSFTSMTSSNYFGLSNNAESFQFSAPFIFDVNGDSLPDLVIGNLPGTLTYYWNYGTRQNPRFSRDSGNVSFGNVNVTPYGNSSTNGFSQPFIYMDKTGALKLLVGSQNGMVYEYVIDPDSLRSGAFTLLDSNYIGHSVGENATVSVADINNDGDLEYLMGTATGGIMMYSDSAWNPGTSLGVQDIAPNKGQLVVYPNPAKDYFSVAASDGTFVNPQTKLYNLVGQEITPQTILGFGKMDVSSAALTAGFYVVRITDGDKSYVGKVLIVK